MDSQGPQDRRPNLRELFFYYNALYFEHKLDACTVEWSSERMTSCAGFCRYKSGTCTIRISEPLHKLRPKDDVKNTLLHEMIHATMLLNRTRDKDGHGPEFKGMMNYINEAICPDLYRPEEGYNITIYHSFEEESEFYRKHWWRCDICGDEIRRAMNRKPQPADCARVNIKNGECHDAYCPYHQHLKNCGGEYLKVRGGTQKPQKRFLSSVGSPLKRRRRNKPTRYILSPKILLRSYLVAAVVQITVWIWEVLISQGHPHWKTNKTRRENVFKQSECLSEESF